MEPIAVKLNVAESNGRTFSILTEKSGYINSVVDLNSDTITTGGIRKLQNIAARAGDMGVLENCDLTPDEKLNFAKISGFEKYYNITLSDDKQFFIIEVKETGMFFPDPHLETLKADFGIPDNVLVNKKDGSIPYDNDKVINKRVKSGSTADGKNTDYDKAELEAGDVIRVPVKNINLSSKPQGFWERPWFTKLI